MLRLRPKKNLGRLVLVLALGMVPAWLAASWIAAWALTRRWTSTSAETPPRIEGLVIEPRRIAAADGLDLGAWLVRGLAEKPVVVLLHGNGDSRGSMTPIIRFLGREGFGALAVSLRAHGDSMGTRNDLGWSAREDVLGAVAFLEKELPGRKVVVLGQSLGAVAAVFAAKDLDRRVSAYILESPYSDLTTAVRNRCENYLPPVLDDVAYLGLRLWAGAFLPVEVARISPLERVAEIPEQVPVLFLAGTADRHARPGEVEALRARVASHARLVSIEGAEHSKLLEKDPGKYERSVLEALSGL